MARGLSRVPETLDLLSEVCGNPLYVNAVNKIATVTPKTMYCIIISSKKTKTTLGINERKNRLLLINMKYINTEKDLQLLYF